MKKKLLAMLIAAVCAFALAACGSSGNAATGSASSAGTSAESSKAVSEASAASTASSAAEASSASSETGASSASQTSSSSASSASQTAETSENSEAEAGIEEENEVLSIPVVDEELDALECVELCDYSNVDVKDAYTAPTDDDVQQYIDSQIKSVEAEDQTAAVKDGDTANINYVGKLDGEAFEGGTGENYDLVIGSGTFIPGFEEGVTGMKPGETKDITLSFPEDYWNKDMAGKEVVFTVTLNSIKVMPEFNDEWVAKYSGTEETTVDGYKAYVMKQLEENAKLSARSAEQMEIWQYVVDNSTVAKIPKKYVDDAETSFDKTNEAQAQAYGMTLDDLLEANGLTRECYDEQKVISSRESAKNNVLYDALWEKENMSAESEEYKKIMNDLTETYGVAIEELEKEYGKDTIENFGKAYALMERLMKYANVVPAE